ncbi:MAG TPA: ribosome maturation factor, partial [Allosphingosinicella sp.]|nr:ribosome maturation factor [Allosphingosinicella sp.]
HEPYEGRKQLSGDLIGVDGEIVRIDVKGLGETAIPFASIRNAKLLMTDRLIKATAPISAAGADVEEIEDTEVEGQD